MQTLSPSLYYRKKYQGLIGVRSKMPIRDTSVLSRLYTPGVGACCMAIADDVLESFELTCRGDNIALVTDASSLYGLGEVVAEAALPMLEARAVGFKNFANIDAFPVPISTHDTDQLAEIIRILTPTFGGIVIDDIKSPKCFAIEHRLRRALPIPVFDNDQHGTGMIVAAALKNSLKVVGKEIEAIKIVIGGAGASAIGTVRRLLNVGAQDITLCDTKGAIYSQRLEHMNWVKTLIARRTNLDKKAGPLEEIIKGADVFIGLSVPDTVSVEMVRSMADAPIVFALALPEPEISAKDAADGGVAVYASGLADDPVQIRSSIVGPGFMRGCLDARAHDINNSMFNAGVEAIANLVPENQLSDTNILPHPLDLALAPAITDKVVEAAVKTGLASIEPEKGASGARLKKFLYEGEQAWHEAAGPAKVERGAGVEEESIDLHRRYRGCVAIDTKIPLRDDHIFSDLYSPKASIEPAREIIADPTAAYDYTAKPNLVGVISDGSAVLGFGNIGPWAAMPVMEGKSILFKTFGGVEAYPLCLATQEVEELVATIKELAPALGGINLEDIAAPRCFEVESQLQQCLDIPVFHDDQHGTAVVALAGLVNAVKLRGDKLSDLRVVVNGAGAASLAITKLLLDAGVDDIIVCDSRGAIYKGRKKGMNPYKTEIATVTNLDKVKGDLTDSLKGTDVFIGVSVAGALTPEMVKLMAKDPIVFAMANPVPEILPGEAKEAGVGIMATGRSDFPNQVNNCLAFPGIFRGALDVRATTIDEGMKVAAARAIADAITPKDLSPDKIIPDAMDFSVPPLVAQAVADAAVASGVARTTPEPGEVARRLTSYIYEERLVGEWEGDHEGLACLLPERKG